ncbi:MAG: tetratricopeptide repeat protein, partial [Candidatus Udaeobacter sp.]
MRGTLGILVRAKRIDDAADIIRGKTPDAEWVYWAAYVYKYVGNPSLANEAVRIGDNSADPLTMRRTRLFFANGFIDRIQASINEESLLSQSKWPEKTKDEANGAIEVLDPLISLVRANRAISGDLQLTSIICALSCAHIAGDRDLFSQCCDWLVPYVPVPLVMGEICLRQLHATPDGFATRLRVEHAESFQARLIAALIERDVLHEPVKAYDALVRLSDDASDATKKEVVAERLFETCCECGPERAQQTIAIIAKLQSPDSPLIGLLDAMLLLHANDLAGAEAKLLALRDEDDPSWWQTYATLCDKKGEYDAARDAWEKASELLPHPDLQRRAIQASLDRRKFESAVRGLARLVEAGDATDKDRDVLARLLAQLGRYPEAVQQLESLVSANPDSVEWRMTLAQCYSHCARGQDGIHVLEKVFDVDDPPLDAFFLQSQLLAAAGKPNEAFALLKSAAGDFWDEPRFLLAYMSYGHAAGNDDQAHEAFVRLLTLRQAGKVPPELLQEKSLEQLIELGTEVRARRELLQNEVVNGQKPWLFVEDDLGNPPVWAWTLHTQPMKWLSEDRLSRAAFTIYATNGFTLARADDQNRLEEISSAAEGTPIVVDLSALISLFQLGHLESAADFATQLILPSTYGVLQTLDSQRFGEHQPSQELSLQAIKKEIETGNIKVVGAPSEAMPMLDEYDDAPTQPCYRLRDIIALLQNNQTVDIEEIDELLRVAHKEINRTGALPSLKIGDEVVADLLTLRTLASRESFQKVVQVIAFHLTSEDQAELHASLLAHESAHDARRRHDELWRTVANLTNRGKVAWESTKEETAQKSKKIGRDAIHIDSVLLAHEKS